VRVYLILIISLLYVSSSFVAAQEEGINGQDDKFTLYLVRHAEKQKDKEDPSLTNCGRFRAQQLATMLKEVKIEKVYSTSYNRTLQTASPTANLNKVATKHYSPRGLVQLARSITTEKQNALIVGHSNTTPALLSILTGTKYSALAEHEYQMLYQIKFIDDQVLVETLRQPLSCK